jgi:plasmid segregation protein ParM
MAKQAQQGAAVENGAAESNGATVIAIADRGEIRYAGVDDGHFGIKVVTDEGKKVFVPSRITSASDVINISDSTGNNWYQTDDGKEFVVDASLPAFDTRFSGYAVSDINRVLVHHALTLAGLGGEKVSIMTGLPVSDYYIANQMNSDLIGRKVKSLTDHLVTNRNPGIKMAKIVRHNVASEAIAAFFDLLFDDNGDQREDVIELVEQGSIGIIDVGGKTTDCAVVVSGGQTIDPARSGTENFGGLSLNKAVEPRLKEAFNVRTLSPKQIDDAVRTGNLRLFQQERDCSEIIATEKRHLAKLITDAAIRKMGDGADLERIFFVGGGSLLLRDELANLFPHAEIVDDPQYANARGMLKAVKYMSGEAA